LGARLLQQLPQPRPPCLSWTEVPRTLAAPLTPENELLPTNGDH
jgi:hypothetical protein